MGRERIRHGCATKAYFSDMGRSETDGAARRASRRRPGELENEVLAVLWDTAGPMSPAEVQAELDGGLAYATVSTILGRLHTKGLVHRTTIGRTHHYEPSITQAVYISEQVRRLLDHGDRSAVLQGFIAGLTPSDEHVLLSLLIDTGDRPDGA
jgi:predicted transcriptional regulator